MVGNIYWSGQKVSLSFCKMVWKSSNEFSGVIQYITEISQHYKLGLPRPRPTLKVSLHAYHWTQKYPVDGKAASLNHISFTPSFSERLLKACSVPVLGPDTGEAEVTRT